MPEPPRATATSLGPGAPVRRREVALADREVAPAGRDERRPSLLLTFAGVADADVVLLVDRGDGHADGPRLREAWCAVAAAWRATGLRGLEVAADGPGAHGSLPPGALLVVAGATADADAVLAHPGPVLVAGPALHALVAREPVAAALGVRPDGATPPHEVRVRPGPAAGQVADRLPGDLLAPRERVLLVRGTAPDVDVHLQASVALRDHPVAWSRADADGRLRAATLLGGTPESAQDPEVRRVLVRLVRHLLGLRDAPPVRVGMLGYGAIGHEHARATAAVRGLELAAVCDPAPGRRQAARAVAADVRAHADGEDLLADGDVDLVVVSTPPSTHAQWVLRALRAGKHVVVEKPFCLTTAEADRQVSAAAERGLLLAVYQNRRFDPDWLALAAAVRSGVLGEVFHYESFVGGYGHPCSYWHSDEAVSGGAVYDWGSHYLDQALDLFPQPVEWVSATAHKRVWHDVTNADHTRVLLHLEGGVEAEFTVSDLAAAPKPKFYVLGTRGALVGRWRRERVVGRDAVGRLVEEHLAPADSPAALTLHAPDGSTTELAVPPAPPHAFHRQLADRLLSGVPMSVTTAASRRGVAVMEAATASARDSGHPVVPAPAPAGA